MKYVLRLGVLFVILVIVILLVILPQSVGNKVFTDPEMEKITEVINDYN
jgi:poly-D-alanine transfer protein DltD